MKLTEPGKEERKNQPSLREGLGIRFTEFAVEIVKFLQDFLDLVEGIIHLIIGVFLEGGGNSAKSPGSTNVPSATAPSLPSNQKEVEVNRIRVPLPQTPRQNIEQNHDARVPVRIVKTPKPETIANKQQRLIIAYDIASGLLREEYLRRIANKEDLTDIEEKRKALRKARLEKLGVRKIETGGGSSVYLKAEEAVRFATGLVEISQIEEDEKKKKQKFLEELLQELVTIRVAEQIKTQQRERVAQRHKNIQTRRRVPKKRPAYVYAGGAPSEPEYKIRVRT